MTSPSLLSTSSSFSSPLRANHPGFPASTSSASSSFFQSLSSSRASRFRTQALQHDTLRSAQRARGPHVRGVIPFDDDDDDDEVSIAASDAAGGQRLDQVTEDASSPSPTVDDDEVWGMSKEDDVFDTAISKFLFLAGTDEE